MESYTSVSVQEVKSLPYQQYDKWWVDVVGDDNREYALVFFDQQKAQSVSSGHLFYTDL